MMKVDLAIDGVSLYIEGTLTECLVVLESVGFSDCNFESEREENDSVWSQIPEKYKWLAMDGDGEWCCHIEKPVIDGIDWYSSLYEHLNCFSNLEPTFNGNWKNSLMERPK